MRVVATRLTTPDPAIIMQQGTTSLVLLQAAMG